jgi:hypothetical protein
MNPDAIAIFDLLSLDENIIAMIDSSEAGNLALAPVVQVVEDYYDAHQTSQFDLKQRFPRTVVGCMIKSILSPFGYEVVSQRDLLQINRRKYFTSASSYAKTGAATMKVVRTVVPV